NGKWKMRNDIWKMIRTARDDMTQDSPNSLSLMIVAGEASGDAPAAALVRALRERVPATNLNFFGSTGAQMRAADVESIVQADELAILGLWEVGRALTKLWRVYGVL